MKIKELLERGQGAVDPRTIAGGPGGAATPAAPAAAPRAPAKKDPAVLARQQELINAGAKIKADGIMGPQTRQAEKDFGAKVDALKASNQTGPTTVTNPAQATQAAAPAATAPAQPGNADPGQGKVDYSLAGGRAQTAPTFGQTAPAGDNPRPPAATAAAPAAEPPPEASMGAGQNAPGVAPAVAQAQAASQGQSTGATAPTAAAMQTVPNPWDGKDPAKAAAWAKLSPEDQQWIGMADPTDRYILARAPSNGGFLGSLGFGKKKKEESITQVVAERNQTYKKDNELLQRMRHIAGLK